MSLLSALMCNLVNNIPMTAMMLSIIQQAGLSPAMNTAMGYSLVIGSNLGANFTTFGALAGILWLESARRYGWNTTITDLHTNSYPWSKYDTCDRTVVLIDGYL